MKPVILCVAMCLAVAAQSAPSRPNFSEYSVKQVYRGKPVAPKLLTRDQRRFRTMIRGGANSKVEFAGHYTVPIWGCGTGCASFAIVDSLSGKVYGPTFTLEELPLDWQNKQPAPPERMEFHPDSRLMKINGCPNEKDCGFYDYVMIDGDGLKLVRKELLPKQFQP